MIGLGISLTALAARAGSASWWRPGAIFDYNAKNGLIHGPALTVSRATSGYAQDSSGAWVSFPANTLRRTDRGLLVEPAGTNKNTNYAAPTNLIGVAKAGDAAATLSVVSDIAMLNAASGISGIASGSVYRLDNSAGVANAYAQISGPTGNTNAHTASVFARAEGSATSGNLRNSTLNGTAIALSGGYARYAFSFTPVSVSDQLWVRASAGATIYFILNQLEETSAGVPSSPIVVAGGAATRVADAITVQSTGIGRFVYTFDDGSTQTVAQNTATQHVVPTNLNRRVITRMTGYAS